MKKLLTVLLTLVMAVYLVNLNNSYVKAEDYTCNDGETFCTLNYKLEVQGPDLMFNGSTNIPEKFGVSSKLSGDVLTIILSKDLKMAGTAPLIDITNSLANTVVIEITKDVELTSFVSNFPIINAAHKLLKINGNYNKLRLTNDNNTATGINTLNDLTLENVFLQLNTVSAGISMGSNEYTGQVLSINNSKIEALRPASAAISCMGSPEPIVDSVQGTNATHTELQDLVWVTKYGVNSYEWQTAQAWEHDIPTYVIINPNNPIKPQPEPTPDPSPVVKDESCEKVIGPTWHWNNDKGICEDYGVVGTATR